MALKAPATSTYPLLSHLSMTGCTKCEINNPVIHIHNNYLFFDLVYCYNCSILLLICRLTASVYTTTADVPWSGYKEKDHGFLLDLGINPGLIKHNFQYEASYRDIIAAKSASFHVREQCGPSLKSALRHICSIDKRDDKVFPTSGSLVQFTTELAGLGGDIGFMKYGFTLQSNYTPLDFIVSL